MTAEQIREALALATDELTVSVDRVEETFRALRLGVNAQVPLDETGRAVAFQKFGKEWKLIVIDATNGDQPLRNCSRACRVRAAECYDALLAELFVQAEAQVSIVKDARERTEDFVVRAIRLAHEKE